MTKRYIISGRVQGVGFRYFTVRRAQELGVSGWVRNNRDGTVEAVAQGEEGALRQFEERLREGPAMALVESLDEKREGGSRDFSAFTIER